MLISQAKYPDFLRLCSKIVLDQIELVALRWRHNGLDSVSNHQPHDCLLSRLFGRRFKKHQSSASLAFVRGFHRRPQIPRTKGQWRGKCFHSMTSSWKKTASYYDFLSVISVCQFNIPQMLSWSNSLIYRKIKHHQCSCFDNDNYMIMMHCYC